jgi:D-alanine-D-alanine ligase
MKRNKILLVGDIVNDSGFDAKKTVFDEDNPSKSEVLKLVEWIDEAGYKVDIVESVNDFITKKRSCKDFLIFPLWRGGVSVNRTAIVPAYCESLNIPYIGGDAYVQIICQDKSLSKIFANSVGMYTPKEIVLRSVNELISFKPFPLLQSPIVIKPLYSACSIGIDDQSLCYNNEQAYAKAESLFSGGLGPVICEEFIAGEEISLSLIEERGSIAKKCLGNYKGIDGKSPFCGRLYTFQEKILEKPPWSISVLESDIIEDVWMLAEKLMRKFGKIDIFRIDGRLNKDKFTMIELTPDIHMSLESIFFGSFNAAGNSPVELMDCIIQSTLKNYKF